MPDYGSNCIRDRGGTYVETDELPVSAALLTRLAQCAERYNINDDFKPEG